MKVITIIGYSVISYDCIASENYNYSITPPLQMKTIIKHLY